MVTLVYACGHQEAVDPSRTSQPRCPVCGNAKVARVQSPAPRITASVGAKSPLGVTIHE